MVAYRKKKSNILNFILIFLELTSYFDSVCSIKLLPPEYISQSAYVSWLDHRRQRRIVDITQYMVAGTTCMLDTIMKYNYVLRVIELYRDMVTFDIGFVVAGIIDTFKHMLRMYHAYADLHVVKGEQHSFWYMLNAYQIVQEDFNKIRLEKRIYEKIKLKHAKIVKGAKKRMKRREKQKKAKGRREGDDDDIYLDYDSPNSTIQPTNIKDSRKKQQNFYKQPGSNGNRKKPLWQPGHKNYRQHNPNINIKATKQNKEKTTEVTKTTKYNKPIWKPGNKGNKLIWNVNKVKPSLSSESVEEIATKATTKYKKPIWQPGNKENRPILNEELPSKVQNEMVVQDEVKSVIKYSKPLWKPGNKDKLLYPGKDIPVN